MHSSKYLYRISQIIKYNISKTRFRMQQQPVQAKLKITQKKKINHDSYIYTFQWAQNKFQLCIGQHLRIVETIPTYDCPQGQEVMRKYTPISCCSQHDSVEMLFKIYRPNVNPNFPQGGKLTPHIEKLDVGSIVNVEGPYGRFSYQPGGKVIIDGEQMKKKRIFFVAGGSGITPCYQTINQIIKMPDQNIELILLFANKTQQDIVLRKQLEAMQPRLRLHYILDMPPQNWTGFSGYATQDVLEKICPLNDPDTLYIHCGPGAMNAMIRKLFTEKFPESTIFKY